MSIDDPQTANDRTNPVNHNDLSPDGGGGRPEFIIVYAAFSLSGGIVGFLLGWLMHGP
ncbi:hypothetical protein [Paludibacterium sp.]|uniref:hypothetical protein n=1 Tax=Paludibacterium sp. TaxID=1917523 RepID=UPI0025EBEEAB|nr:hypothetical protein [Paludibacterium sp.]MBV8647856.1 hypothetical protein [Paludibacterium sp.]